MEIHGQFMVICVHENLGDLFTAIRVVCNESDNFIPFLRTYDIVFPIFELDVETLLSVRYKKPHLSIFTVAEITPIAVCTTASASPDDFVEKLFFIFNNAAAHNVINVDFHRSNRPPDFNCVIRDNQSYREKQGTRHG